MKKETNPQTFGQRIKEARRDAKMTQTQLARRVKMSQPNLSELENDEYPSSSFTPRLAEALRVSSIWLAEGRGLKERRESTDYTPEHSDESSPHEVAMALRRTVRAIALEWSIKPEDLTDPSDEALARIEEAIAASQFKPVHVGKPGFIDDLNHGSQTNLTDDQSGNGKA